ncbi:glycosyl hydrolase family 8 [Aureimonas populi]|uniref:cellulase n=1 Tax=Aureimonas populi TaxID=1701758 RepID=A0ABW5CGM0_9HYPH|nr:glycosyl hydrolase family 8 [Aureimonas populi]
MRFVHLVCAASIALSGLGSPAVAQEETVLAPEWSAYLERFVDEQGRVIDDGNGGISHSEGQGYGLTLAFLAGDQATFERIWSFTRTELMLRDDGLAAWKWSPDADPHVTDINNATDGDMLIAYALAQAGEAWRREDFTQAATALAEAIGTLAYTQDGRLTLPPAREGYGRDERPDGPVINPSYWIYEAFPVLARLAPDTDWQAISDGGLETLRASLTGPRALPPEWLSIATTERPAQGFAAEFGYNAVRIPLYMVRAGAGDEALLTALADGMSDPDGSVALVDLESGETRETLADAGYRIIPALVACAVSGTPVPDDLRSFEPTLYYPSTLHLLALSHLRQARPECLS